MKIIYIIILAVIFVVVGSAVAIGVYLAMEYFAMTEASQLLDEIIAECYEKYPTETEEFRDCRDGAEEKWREMISNSP